MALIGFGGMVSFVNLRYCVIDMGLEFGDCLIFIERSIDGSFDMGFVMFGNGNDIL